MHYFQNRFLGLNGRAARRQAFACVCGAALFTILASVAYLAATGWALVAEPAEAESPREYTFAFWNVENLFDTDDDPKNRGDDEFLPQRGWTPERYSTKLEHLVKVLAEVRPHLLTVAEVENRRVLEDLIAAPQLKELGYEIFHRDSPDKRGIDVAAIYRAPFEIDPDRPSGLHRVVIPNPTRAVLEISFLVEGQPLTVLVNHWPSRGGDRDGALRRIAATICRKVVDSRVQEAQKEGRDADILVLGDFNDDPFDPSVREVLGAIRSKNAVQHRRNRYSLYNPSWKFLGRTDTGTLYYNREWVWNVFDQAILSRGLLGEEGLHYVDGSLSVVAHDWLRDDKRRPLRFRKLRRGGWIEGYSDHFLIHGKIAVSK